MEKHFFSKWRKALISPLTGKILEIGVGTGKNFEYYRGDTTVEGIDISVKMLELAQKRLEHLGKNNIHIQYSSAEAISFPDKSFDYVVATFVFCSVPDPVRGLREAHRVLKDNGRLAQISIAIPELTLKKRASLSKRMKNLHSLIYSACL